MAILKYKNANGEWIETPYFVVEGEGGGGITPTGEITIIENGTHNVTNYATAIVNVAGGGEVLPTAEGGSF